MLVARSKDRNKWIKGGDGSKHDQYIYTGNIDDVKIDIVSDHLNLA